MFEWLKRGLVATTFAGSWQCFAVSATTVEQIIYLYSPKADVNGAFETDRATSLLLAMAAQRGMRVVLLNTDEMIEPGGRVSTAVERLKKTLKKVASDKNSLLMIATHGNLLKNENGTDTNLSVFDEKNTLPYSQLAKIIDPMPTVKAVVSNVCFGFSDALLRTGRSGKVVAACSKRGKEANEVSSRIMIQALGETMMEGPVSLGQALRRNGEKYARKCKSQGNSRSADPQDNLFASIQGDISDITACPSRGNDLPVFDGAKKTRLIFGGKSSLVVDGTGAPVKFCRDPNPRARNNHTFIPGISYDPFFIWRHKVAPPTTTFEGLVRGGGIHLRCEKTGNWKAVTSPPTYDELLGDWDNLDPTCTDPKNLKVRISECDRGSLEKRAKSEVRLQSPYLTPESCARYGNLYTSLRSAGVFLTAIDTQFVCIQHTSKYNSFYPITATNPEISEDLSRDH